MRAGIDLDGVIADLMTPFLKEVNRKFYHNEGPLDKPLNHTDRTTYRLEDWIPVDIRDLEAIWESPEFILNQPLLPWAKWGISRLRDFGYKVYIVTARKKHLKTFTLKWLTKNDVYYDDIVTGKWKDKLSYIERNGLDIFIEDRTKNALEAAKFCKRVYLVDKPYNRYVVTLDESKSNIMRVDGWREIIRYEKQYAKER